MKWAEFHWDRAATRLAWPSGMRLPPWHDGRAGGRMWSSGKAAHGEQAVEGDRSKIAVKYLQSTSRSDYVPNINTLVGQKCGIIVTVGFLMGQATQSAAKAHSSQKMAIVDFNYTPPLGNVDALLFNT